MHAQLARYLRSLWPKGDPPSPWGTWGNFGENIGGVGKSGVLENISGNISETRKDRGKVTMDVGRPIETHQRSFKRYYSRPPTASPSCRLGVCNLATPLISGTGKATDFNFAGYIYRANPNKSPLKILEKRERWRI